MADPIQGIDETNKATVVLLPESFRFLVDVTEASLGALGCHYVTDHPSHIRSLIDILKHAELSTVEPSEAGWMREPREGILLESSRGDRIVFLFTINLTNLGVRGYFYRQSEIGVTAPLTAGPPLRSYFTANASLLNELIVWAVGVGASIPSELRADTEVQDACDYFVRMGETLK